MCFGCDPQVLRGKKNVRSISSASFSSVTVKTCVLDGVPLRFFPPRLSLESVGDEVQAQELTGCFTAVYSQISTRMKSVGEYTRRVG